ncbi:hypothetical protein FGIG_06062, partial [Fasciola gigantica]
TELYYFEKRRKDLLDDHPYALPDNFGSASYQGESILTEAIQDLPLTTDDTSSCEWISVDVAEDVELEEWSGFFSEETNTELDNVKEDPRHHWLQPSIVFCRKMLYLLEKCHLSQTLDNSRFSDLSEFSRFHRRHTNRILRTRRLCRYLRNIFAMQSWQIERCFAFHHWCMTRLPSRLLRLYCDAYTELWNQNKPHLVSPSHDPRPGFSSAFLFNSSQRQGSEEIILACFTFPASPTSNRLNRLLNELSEIGRVSVETPEEQACDVMRLRFRLFNRRVLTLLEEPKRGPIYLVGFGVGSILVLSSAMHLQSVDVRDDRYTIAGLICLGMPLLGLKGPRGYPNDPLLSIPEIPTLFIVGSASRLGGHKQALYFRRLILHARLKSQLGNTPDGTDASRDSYPEDMSSHIGSSPGSTSLQSKSSNISVLTVGGADCLLRVRLSLCEKWCTTQEEVDKRIVVCLCSLYWMFNSLIPYQLSRFRLRLSLLYIFSV